jgi:hypothetical protein
MLGLINKFPAPTRNKGVGCRKATEYVTCSLRTYHTYVSTSSRLVNKYSMIVRHTSLLKSFVVDPLAIPSCPLKGLRVDSFLPML